MTFLDKYLAEVKERAEKATPGPWKFTGSVLLCREGNIPETKENGKFIACSRTDVERLARMVDMAIDALKKTPCTGNGGIHEESCFKCARLAELNEIAKAGIVGDG